LTRITACFEQYRVRAIAFKGPALAQQLQQKLFLRRCRDLDILIEKNQFEEATAAIQSAGYSAIWPDDEVGRTIFRSDKHVLLIAETGRFRVELHWSLALPGSCFPLRFEDLWSRREQISVLGTSIPVPGKEDLLLILCFHAATHWWGSLKWICEIAEFLERYPHLDWELVLARARKLGCCRILLTGVTMAQVTMALRLPETLDREARLDRFIEQTKKDVLCRLSIGAPPLQCTERYLAHVRSRERLRDRLKLVINLVSSRLKPNARDREWIYLPDALGNLYIPVRIIRVICLRYKASVRPLLRAVLSS
jgi:hypothetical protein